MTDAAIADGNEQSVEWLRCALGLEPSQTPFPWQIDLLRRFLRGETVSGLDIPTGLGKTGTMAVWLVARALRAPLPRRLVYVVDRRAVVDQATVEAERLRAWVSTNDAIRNALGLESDLPISTLRGQYVDNRKWLEDPSVPAIVVGTVDMVGSRLLFEGYRCSRKMRPYHAAMLATDTLLVVDEAHLVPPFEALVRAVVGDATLGPHPSSPNAVLVPRGHVVALSATGRATTTTLSLDQRDLEHDVVKQRFGAVKRLHVAEVVEPDALAAVLAAQAWAATNNATAAIRVIVFVESRKTAQEVDAELKRLAKGNEAEPMREIETVLFVGGRRVAEREDAAKRLEDLGLVAGRRVTLAKPVFVIATSAGEVGVDLDADHAVLDVVEWERMVQRLGRVNRRGAGEADVWIVPTQPDSKTAEALEKDAKLREASDSGDEASETEDDAADEDSGDADSDAASDDDEGGVPKQLRDDERARVERWWRRKATLQAIASLPPVATAFDGSPCAISALKTERPDLVETASTPTPLHPPLTRAVVESWSMTSLEDHSGRPEVRPWLRGWTQEEAQTAVVWRTWLPRLADADAYFDAAPVETAEVLETESTAVLTWLDKRAKAALKAHEDTKQDTDNASSEAALADPCAARPSLGPEEIAVFVLDDEARGWAIRELVALDKRQRDRLLRAIADATIVVDARLGGLADGLLEPKANTAARDVSELRRLSFRVREADDLESVEIDDDWRTEATFVSRIDDDGEVISWLLVESDRTQESTTAEGRSVGREQALAEHQSFAERHARRIGGRLWGQGKQTDLLALAAALHDEGKKAVCWQRAFRAPAGKRPLAKTTSRPIQSILAGYRHELGSLPYAEADARVAALSQDDRDLVLHLIAAHHGFARPLLRTDGCEDAPPSALSARAREIALRFARLEKRWGPWGLALWETLLRAADQAASRENDELGAKHG